MLDGFLKRTELMLLADKRLNCISDDEKKIIIDQENALSKKISAIEKQQQSMDVNVGEDFFQSIKDYINDLDKKLLGNRKGNLFVIKALFQADSVIAYRCINKISDMVMSSDSDLAALAGEQCLAIKSFKFLEKNKGEKLSNMDIYTPSTITLSRAMNSICLLESSNRIKKSDFPIFDKIDDINIRGLLAVGLGCDVFLSGVYNIGKVKIKNFIDNETDISYGKIMKFYSDSIIKTKTNENFSPYIFIDAINIYV